MVLTVEEVKEGITKALSEKGSVHFFHNKINVGVDVLSKYSDHNVFCGKVLEALKVVQKSCRSDRYEDDPDKYRFPFSKDDVIQDDPTSNLVLKGEADFMKFVLDALGIKSSIFTSKEGHSLDFGY